MKLMLSALAGGLLFGAVMSTPAEARCWWNGYSWHCTHYRHHYWHARHWWRPYPYYGWYGPRYYYRPHYAYACIWPLCW